MNGERQSLPLSRAAKKNAQAKYITFDDDWNSLTRDSIFQGYGGLVGCLLCVTLDDAVTFVTNAFAAMGVGTTLGLTVGLLAEAEMAAVFALAIGTGLFAVGVFVAVTGGVMLVGAWVYTTNGWEFMDFLP